MWACLRVVCSVNAKLTSMHAAQCLICRGLCIMTSLGTAIAIHIHTALDLVHKSRPGVWSILLLSMYLLTCYSMLSSGHLHSFGIPHLASMHCRLCHIYPGMLMNTSTMLQCVVSCLMRALKFSIGGCLLLGPFRFT